MPEDISGICFTRLLLSAAPDSFSLLPGNRCVHRMSRYESTSHLYSYRSQGNDSNLLIVFYVQIMPDDFVMQLHRILRTTATSVPAVPDAASQIQVMPLNPLRISLCWLRAASLQAGFIQRPAIRHPYHDLSARYSRPTDAPASP